jgi:hypothetical protein
MHNFPSSTFVPTATSQQQQQQQLPANQYGSLNGFPHLGGLYSSTLPTTWSSGSMALSNAQPANSYGISPTATTFNNSAWWLEWDSTFFGSISEHTSNNRASAIVWFSVARALSDAQLTNIENRNAAELCS